MPEYHVTISRRSGMVTEQAMVVVEADDQFAALRLATRRERDGDLDVGWPDTSDPLTVYGRYEWTVSVPSGEEAEGEVLLTGDGPPESRCRHDVGQ